jgi:hypothetical protein
MDQASSSEQAQTAAPFFRLTRSPLKFRLYLLSKLPAAFFAGLRIPEADLDHCVVTVPYRWSTRNPFRSIYFACLGMAAEMSTGVLAMAQVYKSDPRVSMLVTGADATFVKKATGLITFICNDGQAIRDAVAKSKITREPQMIKARTIGTNGKGETVAEFLITWSFKVVG